jgi:hypothetical protein
VRDEDGPLQELRERRSDRFDRRRPGNRHIVDARQIRDEPGDRKAGIDERGERPEAFPAEVLGRADLGDGGVTGRSTGGLEVDGAERDLRERDGQVERGLVREQPALPLPGKGTT